MAVFGAPVPFCERMTNVMLRETVKGKTSVDPAKQR